MPHESAPQPEGEKDNKEKKDKRRWLQFSLLGLFLIVTGSAAAINWWRNKKLREAAEPFRARWEKIKEFGWDDVENPKPKFLQELRNLRESIGQHNQATIWQLSFQDVHQGGAVDIIKKHVQTHFEALQDRSKFPLNKERTPEIIGSGDVDALNDAMLWVKILTYIRDLADVGGFSQEDVLDRKLQIKEVEERTQACWQRVVTGLKDPDHPMRIDHTAGFIILIKQMLETSGLQKEDVGIQGKDLRAVVMKLIPELWQHFKTYDGTFTVFAMIAGLCDFTGLTSADLPSDIQKEWRQVIREKAKQLYGDLKQGINARGIQSPYLFEDWERLHLYLKHGELTPSDLEISPAEWEKLKQELGKPSQKSGEAKTSSIERNQAETVAVAHQNFLLRTLDQMRQNPPLVLTVETAAIVASFFTAAPVLAAATSLALTVKLAQLAGAGINKLLGRKS